MGALVASSVVPLLSVLIGAALTYWLNVRARQRNYVVDLFNQAITAVATADAGRHYIRDVAKPRALSEDDHRELLGQIARAAIESHTRYAGEARTALAQVYQYEPAVKPYYQDATAVIDRPEEIIAFLIDARDRLLGSRRKRPPINTTARPRTVFEMVAERAEPLGRTDVASTKPGLDSDNIR